MANDPIVLDPPNFSQKEAWNECSEFVENCGGLCHEDGKPNLKAASGADPGVVSCPVCKTFHWAWGNVQQCTQCSFVYPVDWWPMFSWGAQAALGVGIRADVYRMNHRYFSFGFNNPPEGDLYAATKMIDWKTAVGPW